MKIIKKSFSKTKLETGHNKVQQIIESNSFLSLNERLGHLKMVEELPLFDLFIWLFS